MVENQKKRMEATHSKSRKKAKQEKQEEAAVQNGRCALYLEKKNRRCRFPVVKGDVYCRNHSSQVAAGGETVQCPACTTVVVLSELHKHMKRCPKQIRILQEQAEPHFCADINAGSEEEPDLQEAKIAATDTAGTQLHDSDHPHSGCDPHSGGCGSRITSHPFCTGKATARVAAAQRLGREGLQHLLARLQAVYAEECQSSDPPLRVLRPPQSEPHLVPKDSRQFSMKHALQQASIVGHIIDMGLVPGLSVSGVQGQQQNVQGQQSQAVKNQQQSQAEQNQQQAQGQQQTVSGIQGQQHNQSQLQQQGGCVSLVELGAGKAGLAAMVVESLQPAVHSTVVMDNQAGFLAKSDRWIRQACTSFHRYALDLKDFAVWRTPALQPVAAAVSSEQQQQSQQPQGQQPQEQQQATSSSPMTTHDHVTTTQAPTANHATASLPWFTVGKHLCGAATDYTLRGCLPKLSHITSVAAQADRSATAVNSATGVKCAQTCTAGGSVAGVGCAAQTGIDAHRGTAQGQLQEGEAAVLRQFQGLAIATCCHHRCGWQSYVGKQAFRDWGFSPQEFELVCWMTGWALCGHDAPPGTGGEGDAELACEGPAQPEVRQTAQQQQQDVQQQEHQQQQQGEGVQQHDNSQQQGEGVQQQDQHGWDPARSLPREQRMAIGALCKRLIDRGRLRWLCQRLKLPAPSSSSLSVLTPTTACQQQGPGMECEGGPSAAPQRNSQVEQGVSTVVHPVAKIIRYIEPGVSGENSLLLARTGNGPYSVY